MQELYMAAGTRDKTSIESLLEIKRILAMPFVDINSICPESNMKAINFAAKAGNLEILSYLIEQANASLNADNCLNLMMSAAHCQTSNRHAIISYTTDLKLKLYTQFNDGTTDLHAAALAGNSKSISEILSKNSEQMNQADQRGRTALFWALCSGSIEAVDLLLKKGDENKSIYNGYTPILIAMCVNQLKMVKWLIGKGADINSPVLSGQDQGITPIFGAAESGYLEIVELLLSLGCDAGPLLSGRLQGFTPLYIAAQNGQVEIVKRLVEQGIEFKKPCELTGGGPEGMTPIFIAALTGHVEVVRFLITQGADFKASIETGLAKGKTPLYAAVEKGHLPVVDCLVSNGADFIECLKEGEAKGIMPIDEAIQSNHLEIVSLFVEKLIERRVSLDSIVLGEAKLTLLHLAILNAEAVFRSENHLMEKSVAIIKLLVANGADPDVKDAGGQSGFNLVQELSFLEMYLLSDFERNHLEPFIHGRSKDFLKQMLSPMMKDSTLLEVDNQEINLIEYLIEQLKRLKTFFESTSKAGKRYFSKRYYFDVLEILAVKICPFANEYHKNPEMQGIATFVLSSYEKKRLLDNVKTLTALNHYFYRLEHPDYDGSLPTIRLKTEDNWTEGVIGPINLKRKLVPEKKLDSKKLKPFFAMEKGDLNSANKKDTFEDVEENKIEENAGV
jgi:ankyrin repeat protein